MQQPVNNAHSVLADPLQHLISLDKECLTVADLVDSLNVTPEEVLLIAE
jgi:sulfur carrier protein ThiS